MLLGDLANGKPNQHTHAYNNFSLINEIQVEEPAEPAAAKNDLHIVTRELRHEARFAQAHALAIKRARRGNSHDS